MARHRREHQPGGGAGILAAAGAEHQRQLGEGRAARADARAHRYQQQQPAAAARRNERRGRCRHRPRPRPATLRDGAVRSSIAERAMPSERTANGGNRAAITVCVMLATLMQALDTTIANVALPYMQGSVSATQDQIEWVLTSYIVDVAIMTPPTRFLSGRFGLEGLFLTVVVGFPGATMLCGMAQSLVQIVLFRMLQGAFGAALVPLSQSVLLSINPPERQGSAMAMWGVAGMGGPNLGPVVGGWLTQNYSWRYVFYINLPIGILCFLGMRAFLIDTARNADEKLDWFGFGTLSLGIGAMQLLLDRGEELDWFGSNEIVIESIVAASALYLFLVHTFTAKEPFVKPTLFRDRNFAAGT